MPSGMVWRVRVGEVEALFVAAVLQRLKDKDVTTKWNLLPRLRA